MSAALSLAPFLMKLSVFVVLCHVFSIPFCAAREAYSKFVFMGVVGWLIQPKKKREREADIKRERKKTERDRKKDKERQRRAVTSDAVCPHLISACFPPS